MHILWLSFPSWILKRILSPMGTQMGLQMVSKTVPRMGCESFSAICGRPDTPSKVFGTNLDPLWPLWELIFHSFWMNSRPWTRPESIHYADALCTCCCTSGLSWQGLELVQLMSNTCPHDGQRMSYCWPSRIRLIVTPGRYKHCANTNGTVAEHARTRTGIITMESPTST